MNIEDRPTKEFIDYILNVGNDPKYQNETLPALKFLENSKIYLNIDIIEFSEKENDPPDFDIILSDKSEISLEITSFADESVKRYNSFFRTVECRLARIIAKHIHILPTGVYEFYYSPGSENIIVVKSMYIEIPDYKFTIRKDELYKQLEKKVPILFHNYQKSKQDSMSILNVDGNQVGKIRIIKLADSDQTKFYIIPQSYTRMEEWKESELNTKLQNVVKTKEKKYIKNKEWAKKYSQNWLLISDIQNIMGTCNSEVGNFNLTVESSFFDKIYLIQDIITHYRIISISKKPNNGFNSDASTLGVNR